MKRCFSRGEGLGLLILVANAVVYGGACGGGGDDGVAGPSPGGQPAGAGSTPVPADVAQACSTYGRAVCGKLSACSPAELQADFGDMNACAAREALACVAGAGAPGAQISVAVLMACAGELGGATCDLFATRGVASCLLKGRRGDGDGCASDFQCGSGFCKRTRGINCGSCTPFGRVGSPCAEPSECGPGLECSINGACAAPSAPGMPCGNDQPCRFGAYCAGQTCAAQVETAGAACQGRDSCAAHRGLVCSQSQCAAIAFARAGQACGGPGILLCEASGDCVIGQGAAGVCSMVARDGQSCANGQSCLAPAECLSGVCDIPRGTDTGFCN
jgi:hypothetical protein